ncbi:MAG: hypothetical protein ACT4P1_14585 [Sporichthyaceae bacterium]
MQAHSGNYASRIRDQMGTAPDREWDYSEGTPMQNSSDMAGWIIFLMGTGSILMFTFAWAVQTRLPAVRGPQLTGRAAAPYWYSPTGRQDERGIIAVRRG